MSTDFTFPPVRNEGRYAPPSPGSFQNLGAVQGSDSPPSLESIPEEGSPPPSVVAICGAVPPRGFGWRRLFAAATSGVSRFTEAAVAFRDELAVSTPKSLGLLAWATASAAVVVTASPAPPTPCFPDVVPATPQQFFLQLMLVAFCLWPTVCFAYPNKRPEINAFFSVWTLGWIAVANMCASFALFTMAHHLLGVTTAAAMAFVYVVLTAPLLEEYLKGFVGGWTFGIVEFIGAVFGAGQGVAHRIPPLLMHGAVAPFSFPVRVALHASYNLIAMWFGGALGVMYDVAGQLRALEVFRSCVSASPSYASTLSIVFVGCVLIFVLKAFVFAGELRPVHQALHTGSPRPVSDIQGMPPRLKRVLRCEPLVPVAQSGGADSGDSPVAPPVVEVAPGVLMSIVDTASAAIGEFDLTHLTSLDISDPTAKMLVSVCISLAQFAHSPTYYTAMLQFAHLVNSGTDVGPKARDYLRASMSEISEISSRHQATPAELTTEPYDDLISVNPLMERFSTVFMCFSGTAILEKLGVATQGEGWVAAVMSAVDPKKRDTFLERIYSFLRRLVEVLFECVKTGSFAPFFRTKLTVPEFLKVSDEVIRMKSLRSAECAAEKFEKDKAAGLISSYFTKQLDESERLAHVQYLLGYGRNVAAKDSIATDVRLSATVKDCIHNLNNEYLRMRNASAAAQRRPVPTGFRFQSGPGTGKTTVVGQLMEVLAHAEGAEPGPENVYTYAPDCNFFDGFDVRNYFILFDDVDQGVGKPTAGKRTWVTDIVSIFNSKPTPLEQADVALKGTAYANFRAGVYVTNFPDAARPFIMDLTIFDRRFPYEIIVSVKPEFRQGTADILDETKCQPHHEPWIFSINKFVARPTVNGSKKSLMRNYVPLLVQREVDGVAKSVQLTFDNRRDFFKWALGVHKEFSTRQRANAKIANDVDKPFCDNCHLPLSLHASQIPCSEALHQANEEPEDTPEAREQRLLFTLLCCLFFAWHIYQQEPYYALFWVAVFYLGPAAREWLHRRRHVLKWGAVYYLLGKLPMSWFERKAAMVYVLSPEDAASRYEALVATRNEQLVARIKACAPQLKLVAGGLAAMVAAYAYIRSRPILPEQQSVAVDGEALPNPLPERANPYRRIEKPAPRRVKVDPDTISLAEKTRRVRDAYHRVVNQNTKMATWAVCVVSNVFLVPRHLLHCGPLPDECSDLEPPDEVALTFKQGDHSVSSLISSKQVVPIPGKDAALIIVPEIFPSAVRLVDLFHPTPLGRTVSSFDSGSLIGSVPEEDRRFGVGEVKIGPVGRLGHIRITYPPPTADGDCGRVVVAAIGARNYLTGIHSTAMMSAGFFSNSQAYCVAQPLCGLELDTAIQELVSRGHSIVIPVIQGWNLSSAPLKEALHCELPALDPLPYRSEVAAAERQGIKFGLPLGTLADPLPLSNMVSRVRFNPRAAHFEEMREDASWQFAAPVMRGKADEAKLWHSPYVNHFATFTNKGGDQRLWDLAVEDYVDGVSALAGLELVAPLPLHEALAGCESRTIGALNLSTSTGLPLRSQKNRYIFRVGDDYDIAAHLDDELAWMTQEIRDGVLPIPVALHSLKDEPVSPEKVLAMKTRVIVVFAMAVNILLKRYLTPLDTFMAAHPEFFEGAGFLNPASKDVSSIVAQLQRLGSLVGDGDFAAYAERSSTKQLLAVRAVYSFVASFCPLYSEEDRTMVAGCLMMIIYTARYIKNDLVLLSHSNPSGQQVTLGVNSVGNALLFRYTHYAKRRDAGLALTYTRDERFRLSTSAIFVGDDNAFNSTLRGVTMKDMAAYMPEVGHVYTSADKKSDIGDMHDFDSTMLIKRSFHFNEDFGRTVMPLARKTLYKMATTRVEGDLSEPDHWAVLATSVLREAAFHGRDYFNRWRRLYESLPSDAPELASRFFVLLDYDEVVRWANEDPKFNTWDPVVAEFAVHQMMAMESDVGKAEPTAPVRTVGLVTNDPQGSAAMSKASTPNDFLTRNTLVKTYTISSTDVAFSAVGTSWDVFTELLSDPVIASKVSGYNTIRGTVELNIMASASASAFGAYNLSLICDAGRSTELTDWNTGNVWNSTQDLHALIDMSTTQNVCLQLPFVCPYDAADMDLEYGNPHWEGQLYCVVPLRDDIAAGGVSATITVYARFTPDYVLSVPRLQGSHMRPMRPQGTKTSAKLGFASQIVGYAAAVPGLAPFAEAASAGLAAASTVADLMGFTREAAPEEPSSMMHYSFGNVATTDGVDKSRVAAFTNGAKTSIDPAIGSGVSDDLASFESLFKRPTIVASFEWASDDPVGTILWNQPVTPFVSVDSTVTTDWYPTVPGFVGAPFQLWRGTMMYEVRVIASMQHRGELQLFWSKDSAAPSYDVTNETYNCIMDITTAEAKEISVGWNSAQPAKRVMFHRSNGATSPLDQPTINGFLRFRVHSLLRSSSSSPVQVVILAYAANDMRFGMPRLTGAFPETENTSFDYSVVTQGEVGDVQESSLCELGGMTGDYPLADVCWSEAMLSTRAFLQKFSPRVNVLGTVTSTSTRLLMLDLDFYPEGPIDTHTTPYKANNATLTSSQTGFSWFGWYSSLFVGMRGGMRYKYVFCCPTTSDCTSRVTFATYGPGDVPNSTAYYGSPGQWNLAWGRASPGVVTFNGIGGVNAGEVVIPYQSRAKFYNTNCKGALGLADDRQRVLMQIECNLTASTNYRIDLYAAGSSDIAPIYYRRAPKIVAKGSNPPSLAFANPQFEEEVL